MHLNLFIHLHVRIATKGVVRLFNAIRTQQGTLETGKKMPARRQKEVQKTAKSSFLTMLKRGEANPEEDKNSKNKEKETDQQQPRKRKGWLDDSFGLGANMNDWNKEEEVEMDF